MIQLASDKPLWTPSRERIESSNIHRFARYVEERAGRQLRDYDALWRWSVADPETFWDSIWDFCAVIGERGARTVVDRAKMPGAQWYPDAKINLAENLLREDFDSTETAVVFWGEDKVKQRLSRAELRQQVTVMASAMRAAGLQSGDCVAALLPNMPATLVVMLAAASIGAVFTSTSPDFGVQGVLDRFGQTKPKLLFAADGYWYNRKPIDCLHKIAEIARQLSSVKRCIIVPYLKPDPPVDSIANSSLLANFIAKHTAATNLQFERLPFNHPVYILYSSGTTGVPKGIVHGAGGVLLQHLKEQRLHADVRPGDRYFYFTTCGWMMWNMLVSALASGAAVLMYDGSPLLDDGRIVFRLAEAERLTHFGTSAKFIDAIAKNGLSPRTEFNLDALRVLCSTGSPLVPESFDYVYREIKSDLHLVSMSGGTDICSCFVTGSPDLPVFRGEIQCRALGMAVDVFDDEGRPVRETKGELVCTQSFPALPIGFWNDPESKRYHAAYFERFPDTWCHGDFCEITGRGGIIIYGRSDAVLNPGGVRIGTAEIYRQVEKLTEVLESIAIGQDWRGDVRVVLFVRLREGVDLNATLQDKIRAIIKSNATPRHVPAKIVAVTDIPRTKSGKIVELAVRDIVHGRTVKNIEALANPEALDLFRARPELQAD